jgi:chromosome segregation ATPase
MATDKTGGVDWEDLDMVIGTDVEIILDTARKDIIMAVDDRLGQAKSDAQDEQERPSLADTGQHARKLEEVKNGLQDAIRGLRERQHSTATALGNAIANSDSRERAMDDQASRIDGLVKDFNGACGQIDELAQKWARQHARICDFENRVLDGADRLLTVENQVEQITDYDGTVIEKLEESDSEIVKRLDKLEGAMRETAAKGNVLKHSMAIEKLEKTIEAARKDFMRMEDRVAALESVMPGDFRAYMESADGKIIALENEVRLINADRGKLKPEPAKSAMPGSLESILERIGNAVSPVGYLQTHLSTDERQALKRFMAGR